MNEWASFWLIHICTQNYVEQGIKLRKTPHAAALLTANSI